MPNGNSPSSVVKNSMLSSSFYLRLVFNDFYVADASIQPKATTCTFREKNTVTIPSKYNKCPQNMLRIQEYLINIPVIEQGAYLIN
jgi:hypothetical protein